MARNDDRPYVPIDELTVSWADYRETIASDREQAERARPKPPPKAAKPKAERTLIKTT